MGLGIGRALKKVGRKVDRAVRKAGRQIDREIRRQPGGYVGTLATGGLNVSANQVSSASKKTLAELGLGPQEINFPTDDTLAMPTLDEEAVARARKRAAAAAARSGGRQSTILTGGTGTLLG